MLRRPPLALCLALGLYVVFHGLVLHTAFDTVCLPHYELFMGNIAKVTLEGGYGPPLHQYYDNCGGHLVTGLLAAPLFALFGSSYLVLKLVPLGLGALAMIAIWSILARHFDRRAAGLAVLLFAIGPPTLAKYAVLAKGNHFENLFFQLFTFWCFYRLHTAERRTPWLVATAMAAGFSIFFYFGSLAMLALLALLHLFVRGPRGSLRDLRVALPAALVGLAPLAWVNLSSNARPAGFLNAKLGGGHRPGLDQALDRMSQLVTDFLPRGGCYEDLGPLPSRIGEGLWLFVYLAAFLLVMPRVLRGLARTWRSYREGAGESGERERFDALASAPLVAFLPTFVVLYGFSTFEFKAYAPPVEVGQFRYLVPHYTFSCLLVGIAAASLWKSRSGLLRGAGWLLATLALSTHMWSLPLVDFDSKTKGVGTRYDGYEMTMENNVLQRDTFVDPVSGSLTWDWERLSSQLSDFPPQPRVRVAIGVGNYGANVQSKPPRKGASDPRPAHLSLDELLTHFPSDVHLDLARGVGSFLREPAVSRPQAEKRLARHLPELVAENHPQLAHVVVGLSECTDFPLVRRTRAQLAHNRWLGEFVPAELHWAWWRGQGIALGQLLERAIESDVAAVDAYLGTTGDAPLRELWFGIGFGVAEKRGPDGLPPAIRARFEELAEPVRAAAFDGYGAGLRHALGLEGCKEPFGQLRRALTPTDAAALEFGLRWPDYPLPRKL